MLKCFAKPHSPLGCFNEFSWYGFFTIRCILTCLELVDYNPFLTLTALKRRALCQCASTNQAAARVSCFPDEPYQAHFWKWRKIIHFSFFQAKVFYVLPCIMLHILFSECTILLSHSMLQQMSTSTSNLIWGRISSLVWATFVLVRVPWERGTKTVLLCYCSPSFALSQTGEKCWRSSQILWSHHASICLLLVTQANSIAALKLVSDFSPLIYQIQQTLN